MIKRPQSIRQKQLFQAIQEYLQNTKVLENAFSLNKNPQVRKLELAVRSLNLQRSP